MLEELREQYRQTLPEKITAIKTLLQDVRSGKTESIQKLRHLAHTLHGSGSTFGFPAISATARVVEHASDDDLLRELTQLIRVLLIAAGPEPVNPPIFIIDDDTDITRLLQTLLIPKCPGRQIVVTASAADAKPWLESHDFSLIVLDLLLPDSDGRELLKSLRAGKHRDTPVFVLSGVDINEVRDECLALGANRVYAKPFDANNMATVIAEAVNSPGAVASSNAASPAVVASAATPPPVRAASAATGATLFPVLVAEDDELLVNVIRHRLSREGLQVHHVGNGTAAIKVLEEKPFCLVILDVKMPKMDGFEVLTQLRQRFTKAELPVIMLTAMGSEKDIVRGYDLGANDYVLKPFSPVELMAKVKNQLRLA